MMMHNADLADTLGNLLHRAANLTLRMCDGVVPDVPAEVIIDVARLRRDTEVAFQSYALQAACEHAINAVKDINKYLTDAAPWAIKDDSRRKAIIVRSTLEALYVAAHFLSPYIPTAAETIFARLNTQPQPLWSLGGDCNLLKVGTPVTSGDILFAKFEREAPEVSRPPPKAVKPVPPAADAPLDVSRLDIRVGQVLKVRPCACLQPGIPCSAHTRRLSVTPGLSTCTSRASTWATSLAREPS
jgi:methionyl-tRNA synthetase